MKIGISAPRILNVKKHGIEYYAIELIRNLEKLDSKNEYYIFVHNPEVPISDFELADNFKVVPIQASNYFIWEQVSLPKMINEIGIDVLHCTNNTSCIFTHVPIVTTLHDIIFFDKWFVKGSLYQNFGNIYRRFFVPFVVKRSSKIIVISKHEHEKILKRLKINPNKVVVNYNGVNNNPVSKDASTEFEKLGLPEKYLIFLGNSLERKNAKNTILGYLGYIKSVSKPLPIVLPGLNLEYVRKIVKDADILEKYFHFPGFIPDGVFSEVVRSSSLLLFPSLSEGFGLPILEAMANDLPVITSNVSSMPEIAGDAALLVNPYDPYEITEGIRHVLDDETKADFFVQKGRERIKHFSWEKNAQVVLTIYNQLS